MSRDGGARAAMSLLRAAGFFDTVEIANDESWLLYKTTSRDVLAPEHLVLVFRPSAKWSDVDAAQAKVRERGLNLPLSVIVWKSCRDLVGSDREWGEKQFQLRKALDVRQVHTNQTLLHAAARRALVMQAMPEEQSYFVSPNLVVVDNGVRADHEVETSAAIPFICDWLTDTSAKQRMMAVIAPGGVGKTTLARQLARKLQTSRAMLRIPLLVESDQWANLPAGRITLAEVWKEAFEHHYRHLVSQDNFEALLENDCLVLIFDGLDELCNRRPSDFDPAATLESLYSLLESTDSKMVLTARETFWRSLPDALRDRPLQVALRPFDENQGNEYLEKRFAGKPVGLDNARRMIDRLRKVAYPSCEPSGSTDLWALPLVLYYVCESVNPEQKQAADEIDAVLGKDPLRTLFLAVCERERARRNLQLTAEAQLRLFETLAAEYGAAFSLEELRYICDYVEQGWSTPQRVGLLREHPLLDFDEQREQYRFEFDFTRSYLRAQVARRLIAEEPSETAIADLARLLAPEAHGQGAVLDHLVLGFLGQKDDALERVAALWNRLSLMGAGAAVQKNGDRGRPAASASFHLANRLVSPGAARAARTEKLLSALGWAGFERCYFEGRLTGLDLSQVRFIDCEFFNSGFHACTFGPATEFRRCRLRGTYQATDCTNLQQAAKIDCVFEIAAREALLDLEGPESIPVDRRHLVDMLEFLLRTFRAGGHFREVFNGEAGRGPAGHTTLSADVLRELEDEKVLFRFEVRSPARKRWFAVNDKARHEVQVFLDNRALGSRLQAVVERLHRRWCTDKAVEPIHAPVHDEDEEPEEASTGVAEDALHLEADTELFVPTSKRPTDEVPKVVPNREITTRIPCPNEDPEVP